MEEKPYDLRFFGNSSSLFPNLLVHPHSWPLFKPDSTTTGLKNQLEPLKTQITFLKREFYYFWIPKMEIKFSVLDEVISHFRSFLA